MKSVDRIKQIFCEALEQGTEDARKAYLDRACQDDPKARRKIEALLEVHARGDSFLKGPILNPPVFIDDDHIQEGPGTVIGRYKLLERIGEGGWRWSTWPSRKSPSAAKWP